MNPEGGLIETAFLLVLGHVTNAWPVNKIPTANFWAPQCLPMSTAWESSLLFGSLTSFDLSHVRKS